MKRTNQLGESTAVRRRAANEEGEVERRVRLMSVVSATRKRVEMCTVDLTARREALGKLEREVERLEEVQSHAVRRHQAAESAYRADVDDAKRAKALSNAIRDVAQPRLRLGDL